MGQMTPSLILINPWIYDFAAYDLWSKPLGLLYLAAHLRRCGFSIHLIDCLDVHHPGMKDAPSFKAPTRRSYGTGKFFSERAPRPLPLGGISRSYSKYGITTDIFIEELKQVRAPAAILVTSLMTYWYPGVVEVIGLAKEHHPNVPIILGGIYARLCREHALRFSGADRVAGEISHQNLDHTAKILEDVGVPVPHNPSKNSSPPYPAFEMLRGMDYVCLMTSTGCPHRCSYCASHFLYPSISRRTPLEVLDELLYWHKDYGVKDFAFYDDALLMDAERNIVPLLAELSELGLNIRFHVPNALHVRAITPRIAGLLFKSGFRTIRLGLETTDWDLRKELDNKVSEGEFERAVVELRKAGFSGKDIGAYILMGLPGQSVDSVKETINFVGDSGAFPYLAEYSPLPHTPLWEKAVYHSRYDLASEPLFHNNTLLPCWNDAQLNKLPRLKERTLEIRRRLRSN